MPKQKTKAKRSWIYWVGCLVLVVVSGVAAYLVCNVFIDKEPATKQETVVSEEEQTEEQGEGTEPSEENEGEVETPEPPKKTVQYEGEDPNGAEELTGVITYAGVMEGSLVVRTSIDQFLGEGTCELTIVQGGVTVYSETSGIGAGAATSACEGFDVPMEQVGGGAMQIMVKLSSGGKTGILSTEVEL